LERTSSAVDPAIWRFRLPSKKKSLGAASGQWVGWTIVPARVTACRNRFPLSRCGERS
jgi:hypothetical protein